jgi:hypothetical protein
VFVIGAEGSGLRRLTDQSGVNTVPAWSPDGKWIYFNSSRSGHGEVWRMPSAGGRAEQVTRNGGVNAYPSRDGEWIYYLKGGSGSGTGPLWRTKPDGSGDGIAVDRPINSFRYTAMPGGVYYPKNGS